MVFESVVADILNIYIGDYVENLDRSQLKIGIWGGDVVLQDLVLKTSVLDGLDLPVKCTFGHLGRLVLKIPWKNLYSAPVIATVERLFLLAVPEPECHDQTGQKAKQALLQRLEVARCLKKEADKADSSDTFVEKLATQIIKNIQIKIQDIHIRYEDSVTNPKCPFSLGITLHNLSVQSTDKNWREGIVQDASTMIFKVLNLKGLAVYWNCQSSMFMQSESKMEMLNLFQKGIFCDDKHPEKFAYILGPITSAARLQLNPKPEKGDKPFEFPKILLTVLMDTLAVGISQEQYHSLVELLNFFDFSNKISEYQKWKFAKNCILSRRWRGVNWEQLRRHCITCRDYASLYMQKLQAGGTIPVDVENEVCRCESELDVFNIIRIRRQVEAEVEWLKQKTPKEPQASGLSSWIGSWWRGADTSESNELTDKFKHELTAEEKLKLYQAIDYEENADPAHYPEEFVERQVVFHLGKLILNIQDNKCRVLLAKLSGVFSSLEQRPSAGAFRMSLKMSELGAWGIGDDDTSPHLVKSLTYLEDGSESVLMRLLLETNPLDKSCGRRLHIHASPVQLVYDAHTFMRLAAIFEGPQSDVLVQLQAAAGAQLSEMSALGLQYAIEHHVMTEVEIDLKSSYVLIPFEGCYAGPGDLRDVLVVNLGQLSVLTLPRDVASNPRLLHQRGLSAESIVATMREESYDRFSLELKNVQVLFALSGEDWEVALHNHSSSYMHLVEPISFSCQVDKCLVQNDPSLPNLKIVGNLSTVSFIIEDNRMIHLIKLYESIPFSEDHENLEVVNSEMYSANTVNEILEGGDSISSINSEMVPNSVKLDLKFVMEGVTVSFFRTPFLGKTRLKDYKSEKMLELQALHLGFSLLQRTSDISVTATLGGISLSYSGKEGTLKLLDPSSNMPDKSRETDMLTIKYTTVERAENINTGEDQVQQFLEADFSYLTVLLHHEILLTLLDYGQVLSQCMESPSTVSHVPHSPQSVVKFQKHGKRKTESSLKVSARLHAFNISLLQQQQPIAHFMVAGMEANAVMNKTSTSISARLRNVCLLDPNPLTTHNKIVSILGKEALSLEVVMFNKLNKRLKNGISMTIKAHLTRSRIVFLNSFTQVVMGFLNSFQKAQENIVQAVADAAEAAKKKVLDAHAASQFVVLDISFQAPLIVVPVNKTSLEVLQLDFGQLLIKNELETRPAGPIDLIRFNLHDLQVARVKLTHNQEVASEQKLVLPVTFVLQLARSLTQSVDGLVPEIAMHGHLDNLEASLNWNDVQMIMRILAENFDSDNTNSPTLPVSPENGLKIVSEQREASLNWELYLSMSTLKLHLGLNQSNQINFAMTGSDFALKRKKNMHMAFRIKDLVATNPFGESAYQRVVAVEGSEALSVEVVMFDRTASNNENDITVKATMAQIRFIYLPSLMSSLKEFLLAFNYEPEGIVEAMAGVAEAAKGEVIEAHNQATRIGLNIDLKAPVIILPCHGMDNDVLLLDFGNLTITNGFQIITDPDTFNKVLIDNMVLGLQNLKISRVELGPTGEILNECWLLQPIDFSMELKRCLSTQKFSAVPDLDLRGCLKTVVVALNQEDIQLVMGVLNTFSNSESQGTVAVAASAQIDTPGVMQKETSGVSVLFSFTMEKLIVELFDEKPKLLKFLDAVSDSHTKESSLARCSLILLVINGTMAEDGTISTNLQLTDCQLDDSRQERQSRLTRLLESKQEHFPQKTIPETRNMEITYHKKGQATDVKVHVYSFNLVLSLEYLRQFGNFLSKAFEQPEHNAPKGPDIRSAVSQQFSNLASSPSGHHPTEAMFSLFVHAENPDVFLVEDMEDPKTTSLVLKSDIRCGIYQTQTDTEVQGTVQGLQIYSCCYHPDLRKSTMSQIVQPCSMKIEGSTTHFEVQFSNIRLRVSPGTINLLSRVITAAYSREENIGEDQNTEVNYSDIWIPKSINSSSHWFLKTEIGEEALEVTKKPSHPKSEPQKTREVCILKMPSLTVTVEAGAGSCTLPMIMLTAGINAIALDWSSKLIIDGSMSLQMAYYNSHLALWEPLVEPVEVTHFGKSSHKPWELLAKIELENSLETDNEGDTGRVEHSSMRINIESQDSLELTVTKTCLEVLTGLGQAFQLAGDEVQREGPPAPYHVINHTGIAVSLLLGVGSFKECRQSNEECLSKRFIVPGESVPLRVEDQIDLQSPMSLLAQGQAQEKYLRVLIEDLGDALDLPVVQAGQRHFPLGQDWGLISDVRVESGSTIVTLRSVVQVFNNLGMPIDIHYQPEINSDLKYVDTVPSGEHIDLPFYSLYTPMRELHISVPGYKKIPYAWSQDFSLTMSVLHDCKSIQRSNKESVFLRIIREKHQAYSKNSNTQGSNSIFYKLFVQPAVKLKNLLPVGITVSQPEISVIHVLTPGDRLNIATARPDDSKLSIQIPDYRQEAWHCTFSLSACESSEFSVLIFKNERNMSLSIGAHAVKKQGVFIVTLYSPYWILNKTGLPLSYKLSDGSALVTHQSGDARAAVMFPSFSGNMKAAIQVADGNWSQCFSLDVPGSTGVVTCPALGQLYRLGVSVQLMRCTLTKQVTITPHFVLINSCEHAVECQEASRPADLWVKVEPGDSCAIWPVNPDNPVKLRARMSGTHQISAPFPCSVAHTTLLRLDNEWGGLNVDVQLNESSVYITFAGYEPGQAAALLVNHSDSSISFSERGSNAINLLNPETEVLFTWSDPTGPCEIDFMLNTKHAIDKEVCQLRRDGAGSIEIQRGVHIFWSSFLDGAQRVMVFSKDSTITESGQELGKDRVIRSLTVNLSGLGLSIIDNEERIEVLYIAVTKMPQKLRERYNKVPGEKKNQVGLWMKVKWFPHEMQVHAKLDHLQADCQLPESTYPVALAPVPPSRSVAASNVARPFMEFSTVVRKAKHSSLQQIQYCKTLIQAFQVKLDMGLISALAALVEAGEPSDEVEVAQFLEDFLLVKALLPAHVALGASRGQKHYFCLLHFSPLKIHLSLSLSGDAGVRKGREPPHALRVLLHSLGVTLTNAQDVVFRLAYFERQDALLSIQQLLSQANDHYRSQVLKQLYVLVLGLDVLGNPLNFVKGLKQGVEDGAIQGPEEFAQGIALGVRSFVGHTVGGAFGAVSRITGAVGSGVAALSFDEDYKRKRQEAISNRPSSVTKGLAQSGEGLVKGVMDGVSGVFTKPISGAKRDGVEGFFKGFGKGMVGLVARPTAGIIDFASGSFDAIRRTTETTVDVERQRPPRFFRRDGRVRPYVFAEAEGNKILQDLEKKDFAASDTYDCHIHVESSGQSILLLTNKRAMLLSRSEFFETWKMEWQLPWETVQLPVIMEDGIYLSLKGTQFRSSGKGSSKNLSGRKVVLNNPDMAQWIAEKMKILIKQ
ncbi:Vacuolar protein sorting-associated protein 13 [Gryllus bimaculatus]|nr:Vacuolar protein sorting-associated protein 13 [Gryllus bimaculatus]